MVAVFIYNILLIVLFTAAMSFAIAFYLKEKKQLFLILAVLLAFFIFDNVIIYMTEFINSFASSYNQVFMNVPVVKTIVFMVNNFCSVLIITQLLEEKVKPYHYAMLIVTGVWMMAVPMMENSALKVWLYYLPNQLLLIYLGFYALKGCKKRTELASQVRFYLKWIAVICLISGTCILLEDTFVIFNVDQYSSLSLKIYNRNICEDIYSIVICLLMLRYFGYDAQGIKRSAEEKKHQEEETLFTDFCRQFSLTQRESEILKLLLAHKQNQEIADGLFLSIGTVKTHVHNIYVKLDISRRNQIDEVFQTFQEVGASDAIEG